MAPDRLGTYLIGRMDEAVEAKRWSEVEIIAAIRVNLEKLKDASCGRIDLENLFVGTESDLGLARKLYTKMGILVEVNTDVISLGEAEIPMTRREMQIIRFFMQNGLDQQKFPRDSLERNLDLPSNSAQVWVSRINSKVRDTLKCNSDDLIEHCRGCGYYVNLKKE